MGSSIPTSRTARKQPASTPCCLKQMRPLHNSLRSTHTRQKLAPPFQVRSPRLRQPLLAHAALVVNQYTDHSQGAQVQTPITSVGYSAGGPTTSEPGLEATAPLHHETGAPGGTSYDQQTQSGYSVVTRGKDVATPFPRAPGGHSVASHQHHSRSSGGQRHRSSRDKHSHQTVPRESRNTALYDPGECL